MNSEVLIAIALTVIGAILGAVIAPVGDLIRNWLLLWGGELTGNWKATLPPSATKNYERTDRYRFHHRGNRFAARITREAPKDERDRKWTMRGYIAGNEIVGVFWPDKGNPDGSSFGSVVLHRNSASPGSKWDGFYVRPALGQHPAATGQVTLQPLPLKLDRD